MADKIVILDETDKVSIEGKITSHTSKKSNPHGVSLTQLGVTATATELNYVDGVTSNIQTQLNAKVPTSRTVNGKTLSDNVILAPNDIGAMGNTNMLDNWYMFNPVNQRGYDYYDGAGYTIDRWLLSDGTLNVTENGVVITGGADNSWTQFYQVPEFYQQLDGKTCTFSILLNHQLYTMTAPIDYSSYPFDVTVNMTDNIRLSFYRGDANSPLSVGVGIYGTASATLKAAKLEFGSVQTLCFKDSYGNWIVADAIPNYATELAKCQRFFQYIPNVYAYGHTEQDVACLALPTPVTMRKKPEYVCQKVGFLYVNGQTINPSNVYPTAVGTNCVFLGATVPGVPIGHTAILCDASISLFADM